jgi:Uncharacterised protein family (UPF0158)
MHEIVSLTQIVQGIEMQSEETSSWLNRDTGQVVTVSKCLLRQAEESGPAEEPDLHEQQKREWKTVQEIVSSDRYLALPTEFDVHEREIMKEFALAMESGGIRDELLHAIQGGGAFQKFRAALRSYDIEKSWFAFRDEALKLLAKTWCEQHGIPFK